MAATGPRQQQQPAAAPAVDPKFELTEKAGSYVLRITLQGFRKDDFRVQVDSAGRLTVRGATRTGAGGGPASSLHKVFQLPANANLDDIAGRFQAGVLTLTVPKRVEEINKPKPGVAKEESAAKPTPPPEVKAAKPAPPAEVDGAKKMAKEEGAAKPTPPPEVDAAKSMPAKPAPPTEVDGAKKMAKEEGAAKPPPPPEVDAAKSMPAKPAPPAEVDGAKKMAKEEGAAKPPPPPPTSHQLPSKGSGAGKKETDGGEKNEAVVGAEPKESTFTKTTRQVAEYVQRMEEDSRRKQIEQKPAPAAKKEQEPKPKAPQAAAAPEKPAQKPTSGEAVDKESVAETVKRCGEEERAKAAAATTVMETKAEQARKAVASTCAAWKERIAGELKGLSDMKWADNAVEMARRNKEVVAVGVAAFSLGFLVSHKLSRK